MSLHSHYTGHFKSVITKPQNVLVMRDIMANGYRAGGNTKFFGFNSDGEFSLSEARDQIGARLNFEADAGDDPIYASMLAFPMTTKQSEKIHNEITVTSRLLPWETHSPNDREGFPGGAAMYTFYKSRLGLDQVHYGEDLRASQNMEYMSQVRLCPVLEHAHGLFVACNRPTDPLSCVHRARRTTRSASPARTAPSTRSPAPSRPFVLARATGAQMRVLAVRSHPRRRTPIPSPVLCLRSRAAFPVSIVVPRSDARWRRGESVSMQGAREQMLSFEQAQYIGRTKI